MDRRVRLLVTFGFLVVLIFGLYYFTDWFSKVTGYFTGEEEKVKLGQCLQGKGTELYGNEYCADCAKQKEILGNGLRFVNYIEVECDKITGKCPGLKEVPAWNINGTLHYGLKNITELQKISGCV